MGWEGLSPADPCPCLPPRRALQRRILHGLERGQLGHLCVLRLRGGTRGQQLRDLPRHVLVGHEGSAVAKNGVDPVPQGTHQPHGIGGALLGLWGAGVELLLGAPVSWRWQLQVCQPGIGKGVWGVERGEGQCPPSTCVPGLTRGA